MLGGIQSARHRLFTEAEHELGLPVGGASVGDVEHERQAGQPDADGGVGAGDRGGGGCSARLAQRSGELVDGRLGGGWVGGGDDDRRPQFEQPGAAGEDPGPSHPARELVLGLGVVGAEYLAAARSAP